MGHDYDWEYVVVGFKRVANNPDFWVRDNIILGAHGSHRIWGWGNYPRTVFGK